MIDFDEKEILKKKNEIETKMKSYEISMDKYDKPKNKIEIKLKNKEDLAIIESKDLQLIIEIMLSDEKFYNRVFSERVFSDKNEVDLFLKDELINYFIRIYEDLKDNISDFKKQGKEVNELKIKIMKLPLKIKVFKSTYLKKDFDNLQTIIESLNLELKKIV